MSEDIGHYPWSDAPKWANWLAMDGDGWWYWFAMEPEWCEKDEAWNVQEGDGKYAVRACHYPDCTGIDWGLAYSTKEARP